jgi:hypothetical protein
MEQNKAENYVVFMNTTFVKNMAIYGGGLMVLLFMSISFEAAFFLPIVALAGYLASNAVIITLSGLKIPGYQAALAQYSNDVEAKKTMVANYNAIKATKPFALTRNQHLISIVAGFLGALAVQLAMGPAF